VSRRPGGQDIPRPEAWRPGGRPPWDGIPDPIELPVLRRRLAERGPGRPSLVHVEGARESAVLAALFDDGGIPHVVLTRRSDRVTSHRGEVSFPGGRMEPGETAFEAALRESVEEIGLRADLVELVGVLDDVGTVVSRSLIHPMVAVLPGRPEGLEPNPHEVDEVLLVSLPELVEPGVYREERWGQPPYDRPVHFFEIDGDTVWGATARMLVNLVSVALGVEHAPDR